MGVVHQGVYYIKYSIIWSCWNPLELPCLISDIECIPLIFQTIWF
jgi:hypothetical protein